MKINDSIMKNEKLAAKMKVFSEEIDRLQIFRDLIRRKPDEEYGINPKLSGILTRKLSSAKEQFLMINEAFEEGPNLRVDEITKAFIYEAQTQIDQIRELFSKIEYKRF